MDLSKILSISGKPGLYKMVAQSKNGAIVESLADKKRFPAFASERISSLEEISIFTNDEDMHLKDVLKAIHEKQNGEKAIDHKSDPKKLKEFFEAAIPDYDQDRVYVSDIKKVLNWYNLLHEFEMLDFSEEEEEVAEAGAAAGKKEDEEEVAGAVAEKKEEEKEGKDKIDEEDNT